MRLTSDLWVAAYRQRLTLEGISCVISAKGDATAGAILVKLCTMDGRAVAYQRVMTIEGDRPWDVLSEGPETEVDQALARQRSFDPDLWVIEVEDPHGRHMLDAPGLE